MPQDQPNKPKYVATSPTGEQVEITHSLFRALKKFLGEQKPTGRIEVDCRNGGVAHVRVMEVY